MVIFFLEVTFFCCGKILRRDLFCLGVAHGVLTVSEVANLPLTTKKGRLLDYQTRDP